MICLPLLVIQKFDIKSKEKNYFHEKEIEFQNVLTFYRAIQSNILDSQLISYISVCLITDFWSNQTKTFSINDAEKLMIFQNGRKSPTLGLHFSCVVNFFQRFIFGSYTGKHVYNIQPNLYELFSTA